MNFCTGLLIIAGTVLSIGAKGNPEIKAVSEVPDRLFAAMKAKDRTALTDLFITGAHMIVVDPPRSGKGPATTRTYTVESFVDTVAGSKGTLIEKMIEKKVLISGDLAVVTGRYTFHIGDRFSHCGLDTFNLFKSESGWKIANAAFTIETDCAGDLNSVRVPEIEPLPMDVGSIDGIIKAFYETISGGVGKEREWGRDRTLYTPDIRFVSINSGNGKSIISQMTHQQYADSSNEYFVGRGFTEREIHRAIRRFGNIAQVFSTYEWESGDKKSRGRGINNIGLFFDGSRWWISAVSWENEHIGNPIPQEFLPVRAK